MRRTLEIIASILIFFTVSLVGIGSWENQFNYPEVPKDAPMIISEPIVLHPDPTECDVTSEVPLIRTSQYVNLTFEEMDLLEQIAMAEAKGEGSKGMAYVMRVVLNRSLKDGMSIHDVIYRPGQFYTAGMEPGNDECHEALAMVMDGWDESQGALFFNRGGYRNGKEALFQYGNHYFSK